jgi:NAD(P)H-hydrate epimerase
MATGGCGDVLTGIIAGLCAQGIEAEAAAACGVYLHGLAGELAADGCIGLAAGELAAFVPEARRMAENGEI